MRKVNYYIYKFTCNYGGSFIWFCYEDIFNHNPMWTMSPIKPFFDGMLGDASGNLTPRFSSLKFKYGGYDVVISEVQKGSSVEILEQGKGYISLTDKLNDISWCRSEGLWGTYCGSKEPSLTVDHLLTKKDFEILERIRNLDKYDKCNTKEIEGVTSKYSDRIRLDTSKLFNRVGELIIEHNTIRPNGYNSRVPHIGMKSHSQSDRSLPTDYKHDWEPFYSYVERFINEITKE